MRQLLLLGLGLLWSPGLFSAEPIRLNQLVLHDPPAWLKSARVEKVVGKIQNALEWEIRRIQVYVYTDAAAFTRGLKLNFKVTAFFRRSDQTVHLGPDVNDRNFDSVFGHELVHVIFHQKYKQAIPSWLEEGLANYLAQREKVNYVWLATQPSVDVTTLAHPNNEIRGASFHYQTSTAVTEMIAKKCSLPDLLRLSVGRKLTTYLKTYCEIADLNADFIKWVKTQAGKK